MTPARQSLIAYVGQREAESAAYAAWKGACDRMDRREALRLWGEYAKLHALRPPEMVAEMERAQGLT